MRNRTKERGLRKTETIRDRVLQTLREYNLQNTPQDKGVRKDRDLETQGETKEERWRRGGERGQTDSESTKNSLEGQETLHCAIRFLENSYKD